MAAAPTSTKPIIGTDKLDVMFGGGRNDTLVGNAADDRMHGGGGNDRMSGDAGDDTMFGDSGKGGKVDMTKFRVAEDASGTVTGIDTKLTWTGRFARLGFTTSAKYGRFTFRGTDRSMRKMVRYRRSLSAWRTIGTVTIGCVAPVAVITMSARGR